MKEATRMYAKLRKRGVPLKYLNVGGGMAVDYDGSRTTFASSMNYTLQEYAADVVYATKEICTQEQVPVPDPHERVGPRHHGLPRRDHRGHRRPHRHHPHQVQRGAHGPGTPGAQGAGLHPGQHLREELRRDVPRRHHPEGRADHHVQPGLPVPGRPRQGRDRVLGGLPQALAHPQLQEPEVHPRGVPGPQQVPGRQAHRQLQRLPVHARPSGPSTSSSR